MMKTILIATCLLAGSALANSEPTNLRCEYLENPLGIDVLKPRLSWVLEERAEGGDLKPEERSQKPEDRGQNAERALASLKKTGEALTGMAEGKSEVRGQNPESKIQNLKSSPPRGARQAAYQILVASSEELLAQDRGDLWDSGKVESDRSNQIEYAGKPLASRMRCYWKVRVWATAANLRPPASSPAEWSQPAYWTMGLLQPADWSAQWITASKWYMPPHLRPPGLVVAPGGWADVDLGSLFPIDVIRLYFADSKSAPKRFVIEGSDEMQFVSPRVLVDRSAADYVMTGTGAQEFAVKGLKVRHVRLRITAPSAKGNVTVRQMEVISGGRNVALMKPTREFKTAWNSGHAVFMVDGMPSAGEGGQCPPDACPTTTAPLLRKVFIVIKPVRRATLYVAALGMAEVLINGNPVTDAVLGPPFTDYTKRVLYLTHDITPWLAKGENVVGLTLGNGFFSPPRRGFGERHHGHGQPRALVQMEIEYADGTRQTIRSDETWKWARSEIVSNDTYDAYTEDRRLAKPGWDLQGDDDNGWLAVSMVPSLGGKLVASVGPSIRVLGELKPERVQGNCAYFNTLGAGFPEVKINGKAGQTITLNGYAPNYNAPKLTFVLATDGPAVLRPRFMVLSSPLKIQVGGLMEPLAQDSVRILRVHADLKTAGTFETSNPYLNQIYDVLLRTHLNYYMDHPVDPMREKQGWTQDAQNMFETAAYLTDVAGIYRKWSSDFADAQDESGYLGSVVPMVGRQVYDWNSPWWSGAVVLLPWQYYQFYGDRRILEENYDAMRRYVDFLGKLTASGSVRGWADYPYLNGGNANSAEAKEGILSWMGAGDWMNPFGKQGAVPAPLMDMPAWFYYAKIVSDTAALLGHKADAATYAAIADGVKNRYNAKYLDQTTGLYGGLKDSQTAQVLPLALNLVPSAHRELTYQRLLDAIHARKDHLGTGFVGLPFLLKTLSDARETALANKIVNQQNFPGWKTLMHDGVLSEDWAGGGAQMPSCGGAIGLWLYQSVLGIRPDPAGPGFRKFILAPQPDPASGLTWARGSYDSIHGRIVSDWKIEAGRFVLNATIPSNSTATVHVPSKDAGAVTESGRPAATAQGVKFLRMDKGCAVYEVGPGCHEFVSNVQGGPL
jgi:alpha-L-rhamnosidase